jgi:signal transduction histidine kinase
MKATRKISVPRRTRRLAKNLAAKMTRFSGERGETESRRKRTSKSVGDRVAKYEGRAAVRGSRHVTRDAGERAREHRRYFEAVVSVFRESFLVLDSDFRIISANQAFYGTFNISSGQNGALVFEFPGWSGLTQFRDLLGSALLQGTELRGFEIDEMFPRVGRKVFLVNARRFFNQRGDVAGVMLAIHDETAHRQNQDMSAQLLRLQDEERRCFARELHDSTSQSLGFLTMNMRRLVAGIPASNRELRALARESQELIESALMEVRTVSYSLHPPFLDEAGLASAIRTYATGFSRRSGIAMELEIPDQIPRMAKHAELALFRICQECLSNIHRHSGSRSGRVKVEVNTTEVIITVSDKGKGLKNGQITRTDNIAADGVGIASMKERVRQFGGALLIDSSSNGTTVRAVLPLVGN